MRIFTVGHSTRSFDELVGLCRAHGVELIADVRRFPGSRRHPHFARPSLEEALPPCGVAYAWLPELGGRRQRPRGAPPSAWRVAGFAAYADYMRTADFRRGIEALLAQAGRHSTAIMCAEASPYSCHRRLISDWLALHDIEVAHILGARRSEAHHVTAFAAKTGDEVIYLPGPSQLTLPEGPASAKG